MASPPFSFAKGIRVHHKHRREREAVDAAAKQVGARYRGPLAGGIMTAASSARKFIDPVEVFRERADARAYLWSIGDLDLHDAVDVLQVDAERDGLVDRLGQNAVQAI